jgi:hypothetical protein
MVIVYAVERDNMLALKKNDIFMFLVEKRKYVRYDRRDDVIRMCVVWGIKYL